MNKSAVILPKENGIPALLSIFVLPSIIDEVSFSESGEDFLIYIVECPTTKGIVDKRWIKSLNRLCIKREIKDVVCSNDLKFEKGMKYEFNLISSEVSDEIEAMKYLSALIRISELTNFIVTESDIGFIMGELKEHILKMLSDEASSIIIYEKDMSADKKKYIYDMLMYDKGMPPAFTDNIEKIAANSQVLIIDEKVNLRAYQELFGGKILLGKNCTEGKFKKIERAIMWINSRELGDFNNSVVKFNDEILCILRQHFINNNVIDFIKKLPYIKLLDENEKELTDFTI